MFKYPIQTTTDGLHKLKKKKKQKRNLRAKLYKNQTDLTYLTDRCRILHPINVVYRFLSITYTEDLEQFIVSYHCEIKQ